MRIPRVYIDTHLELNALVNLPIETHRYIVNVLRLKENNTIILFNGLGSEFVTQIISIEKKLTIVKILQEKITNKPSPIKIELALSLIKNDKFDFALQKTVELGVDSITPIIATRSTIKINSKREQNRREHWAGIIQSACEQSGRNTLPIINPVSSISDWLDASSVPIILFEPSATETLKSISTMNKARVLIGPEGGFTEQELELIESAGANKLRLGPRVLRAETAAITAVSSLQLLMGDLNL